MRIRAMKKQSQNKANFRKARMNLNFYLTKDYENIANWTLGENKPNTNPISKGALHYQPDAGILTSETLSGVVEQRLSALGQPENNISTKH